MQFLERLEETFQIKQKFANLWQIILSVIRKIILILTYFITGEYHLAKMEIVNWKSLKSNPENQLSTYRIIDQDNENQSIFTDEEIQDLIKQAEIENKTDLL